MNHEIRKKPFNRIPTPFKSPQTPKMTSHIQIPSRSHSRFRFQFSVRVLPHPVPPPPIPCPQFLVNVLLRT